MTILDLLRRVAAKAPVKVALAVEGRRFTYADVEGGSNAAARVLRGAGVEPGDRVLFYAGSSLEFVLAWLGALKLGATAVAANPAYRDADLGWILEDSEPKVAVADRDGVARVAELARPSLKAILEIERGEAIATGATGAAESTEATRASGRPALYPLYQALKKASVHPVDEIVADSDLALLLYTSGTTGRGKGAMLRHGNLVAGALALHDAFGQTADDVLLLALPLFHVHGLCVGLAGTLTAGGTVLLQPRFDAAPAIEAIRSERATLFMGVPTMYRRLLDAAGDRAARLELPSMRLFVCGSAPLPPALKDEFFRRTGHRVLERYGMTETLITLAQRHDGKRPAGFVGLPVDGVAARIVDSDFGDVAAGREGELLVRGPTIGPGYWRNDAATEASRHDDWFQTGDLAALDPEVGEIKIVGRARELILSGGMNVYPREVEEALESHPDVAEAAVFGVADADLGETVHAAVVLKPHARASEEDLIEHCRARIASYKKPRALRIVASLPRNAMGKVQKDRLR